MNEYSLHSEIKNYYAVFGDQFEVKLGSYVIDIARENLLIEVQTKNFSAIKEKLMVLTQKHKVRIVYPLVEKKWITYISKDNKVIKKRRSPRKGRLADVFYELVSIPNFIGNQNFSLELLFIEEEEVRCLDGKGSWRRRGASVKDRRLLRVNSQVILQCKTDYLQVLPEDLDKNFTNKELAKRANISLRNAQKITYCLRKSGALKITEKKGRALSFQKLKLHG